MALRLVKVDRETPTRRAEVPTPLWKAGRRRMLLPPDLRDWVPENRFSFNWRGKGSEQYPTEMLLSLLIYSYCTGRFSSRVIEEATHSDVIIRYIWGTITIRITTPSAPFGGRTKRYSRKRSCMCC